MRADELILDMQDYCSKWITEKTYSSTIVSEGEQLLKRVEKTRSKSFCSLHLSNEYACHLDYWSEMVRLIKNRIISNNNTNTNKSSCETYKSFRFNFIGLPTIIYPSTGSTIVKVLTLIFLAGSAALQLIRVQMDGQLSFWSQISYLMGAIISIIYFSMMNQFDLTFPYIGASLACCATIWGLLRHREEPWLTL